MDSAPASRRKKILITGSSGYVGQHLLASLAASGIRDDGGRADHVVDAAAADDVEEVGDRGRGKFELHCAYGTLPTFESDLSNLLERAPLHPSVAGISPIANVDFSEPDCIDKIRTACGEGFDAIVHLAALSSPGYCEKNASTAWKVNCPADLLALNAPIIYFSTDQVYEGTKQFYGEGDETVPVNVYGRTKLAFERVLLRGDDSDDGPILTEKELGDSSMPKIKHVAAPRGSVILRSSLILGSPTPLKNGCRKGDYPSFLQFVESRLKSSTSTDYFVNEFRSVVDIDDVIGSIKHFLRQALDDGDDSPEKTRVFNLGGSTRVSRHDIAVEVADRLGLDSSSANAVNRPPATVGGGGVPSPPDISMNVDKIARELGVLRMNGLKDIVASTFE